MYRVGDGEARCQREETPGANPVVTFAVQWRKAVLRLAIVSGDFLGLHPTKRPAIVTGTNVSGGKLVEQWAHGSS